MLIFVGIDPGVNGAVAVLKSGAFTYKIPGNVRDLRLLLRTLTKGSKVFIELISPRPEQGLQGVVKSCVRFGWLQGILADSDVTYITPQTWQSALGLKATWKPPKPLKSMEDSEFKAWVSKRYNLRKALNLNAAKAMFPDIKVTHQNADALLIAEYGRRLCS